MFSWKLTFLGRESCILASNLKAFHFKCIVNWQDRYTLYTNCSYEKSQHEQNLMYTGNYDGSATVNLTV